MEFAGGNQDKVANYYFNLLHFMFTGSQMSVKQKSNYITASASVQFTRFLTLHAIHFV